MFLVEKRTGKRKEPRFFKGNKSESYGLGRQAQKLDPLNPP
jgi:hypothetical protein